MREPSLNPVASTPAAIEAAQYLFEHSIDLVFSIDAGGALSGLNAAARQQLCGSHWDQLWMDSNHGEMQAALATARRDGEAQCVATLAAGATGKAWQVWLHRLPASDGNEAGGTPGARVLAICRGISACDAAGHVIGLSGIALDLTASKQNEETLRLALAAGEVTSQKQVEDALRSSEERYSTLIALMDQAFCVIEMLYDEHGRPVDFRYLEANPAFAKQSGLDNAIGKTIRSLVPEHEQYWFTLYDQVLKSGQPMRYENEAAAMERWFEVFAARQGGPGSRRLTVLFSDISERKRTERQLRQQADDLSEMDRRKTEFLATLAHELRNPLAPIRNGLQIMRLAADKPDTVARVRDVMERQVNQMVHLVNDLLDVARITRGQIELKRECVDLKTIIAGAVETSMPLIEANRHQLQVTLDEQALPLDADPTRLAQMLGNLLNNAAKYTPAGGHITLWAQHDGGEVIITVRDSGVGIPAESLSSVFDMFTQVGQNMGRAQGGLGIGLSLVRRLAELHGGSVTAASPGAGLGSTFTVRLPLLAMAPEAQAELASSIGAPPASHFRVLVVDDNIDAADTLADLLDMMGHATQVAHDGAQALAMAPQFFPDVIFLDIGLPGMSGYEVARALRQTPAGANAVLVALTGWGAENDRSQSSAAGFDHHLTKPANLHAIGELLATVAIRNEHHGHA